MSVEAQNLARAVAFVFNDGNNGDFVARFCKRLFRRSFLYCVAVNNNELREWPLFVL